MVMWHGREFFQNEGTSRNLREDCVPSCSKVWLGGLRVESVGCVLLKNCVK